MVKRKDKSDVHSPENLRRRAKNLLIKKNIKDIHKLTDADVRALAQELQTYQVELEIQNEELKRARQELEESRNKYLELYEFSPMGYFTLDKQGTILEVNLPGAALLGVERDALVGGRFQLFVEAGLRAEFNSFYHRMCRSDDKQTCELRLAKNDAAPLHAYLEGIAIRDNGGNVKQCQIAVIDITERKHHEAEWAKLRSRLEHKKRADAEALRIVNEKQYKIIIQTAMDGFWVTDKQGKILNVNNAYCSMTGYSREELLSMRIQDLEAIKMHKETSQRIRRIIDTGSDRFETRHRCKDGKIIDVEVSVNYIDVDNGKLFAFLRDITKRKRDEESLIVAYDNTIEGLSYVMDLRDRETENHSVRVAELTLKISACMGIGESDLVHIKRGALLHDIGKIGIPDNILQKQECLTEDEWVVMRKHPVFAYEMLSKIVYLHPAMDIPYCHHEKWDGSGYPQGLKGEQIPIAARISAVVDVWDAFRSDRPYRKAWPVGAVIEHIRSLAGTHFDPTVVETFLNMQ